MSEVVIRSASPQPVREHVDPLKLLATLWTHRELISSFASRELLERHMGALLGIGWNILSPLLQLAVFTVVFGYIFGSRWNKGELPPHLDFPLTFFAGQCVFQVFAEAASRAPTLVSGKPNLVRKVVFPLEILPVTVVYAALVHAAVAIGLLLIVLVIGAGFGALKWTVLLFPLVLVPLAMWSLGIAWALSAIGAFIRDVRHIVVVLVQLLMFLTPLFYQIDRIPPEQRVIRWSIEHNPMSILVESARRVLLWGEMPSWVGLGWVTLLGAIVMLAGYALFSMMRRSMADAH
ncbi:MAG: ABC transporter permease [Phycisphaerales bacterium]|nr:ABC transporter permease [Phycisphaerales bacterium]